MDFKTVCVLFVALAVISVVDANAVDTSNTVPVTADVTASDTTGSATAYLRSKRQFGYPGGGYGGGQAFSSANAVAVGGGGYGGGNAFSSATAGVTGGGYGPYGKK